MRSFLQIVNKADKLGSKEEHEECSFLFSTSVLSVVKYLVLLMSLSLLGFSFLRREVNQGDIHCKKEDIIPGVEARLKVLNKTLLKDGQALKPGEEILNELRNKLDGFINFTLPMIKRLGGVK